MNMTPDTHDLHNGKAIALNDLGTDAVGCQVVHRNTYGGEAVGTLVAVHKDWCVVAASTGLLAVHNRNVPCAAVYVLVEDREGRPVVRNQWALPQHPEATDAEPDATTDAPKPRRRTKKQAAEE